MENNENNSTTNYNNTIQNDTETNREAMHTNTVNFVNTNKEEENEERPEDLCGEEMSLEDIYEKKRRERMMEEERGEDERKRLEELMKMMEGSVETDASSSKKVEISNDEATTDRIKSNAIDCDEMSGSSNRCRVDVGDRLDGAGVDDEERVVEPAPATEGEIMREGGSFDTYLNALSDFNDKFYKLKETPFTQEDLETNSEKKKHFDEMSYVIPSSHPAHLASITTQHTSPASTVTEHQQKARRRGEESDEEEDINGVSPIPDSGVEFCSPDWVQFSHPFHKTPEKRYSLSKQSPHHASYHHHMPQSSSSAKASSLQHRHYHLSTPRIIQSSARSSSEDGRHISSLSNPHLLSTHPRHLPSNYRPSHRFSSMNDGRMTRFGSDSKILRSERWDESQQELRILRELQRDVVLNIEQLQRDIAQVEAQQSEALRDVEVERALLGGERRLVLGEVEALRERLRISDRKLHELSKKIHKDHSEMKSEKLKLKKLESKRKEIEIKMDGGVGKGEKSGEGSGNKETSEVNKKSVSEGVGVEKGEVSELEGQWREAKEVEKTQRTVLENLEFQLLEGESREEDEKEEEEVRVAAERDRLLTSLANKQLELEDMSSQETDLVRQMDRDGEELTERIRLLGHQLDKERSILNNINQQTDLLISFSSAIHPHKMSYQALNRRNESWTKSASPHHQSQHHYPLSLHYPHQRRTASQTLPLLDSYKHPPLQRDRIALMKTFEERSYRYHLKAKASGFSPTSNPALFSSDWTKHDPKRDLTHKAASWLAVNSDSEESCSDSESENNPGDWNKKEVLEKIRDMECQLLIAKAEKMKLVDRQKKELENMQGEIRRRRMESGEVKGDMAVVRRGEENISNSNSSAVVSKLQSRPLTRYLPTPDPSLNLASFVTSCGHNIQQCRNVILTATSCRGYLSKMTGCHLRKWKKRWFVFDRSKRSLCYYSDNRERKARAVLYFQSIEDVFVDHLHQVSSPTPQLTFCLKTLQRAFFLLAPSADCMRVWIDVISTGAEANNRFV